MDKKSVHDYVQLTMKIAKLKKVDKKFKRVSKIKSPSTIVTSMNLAPLDGADLVAQGGLTVENTFNYYTTVTK